ncbi:MULTISPECIES: YihY/virulence factor BrkB family protein [Asticcacaulis]|uniref:YihY/virulence factor BrkB family protein n=1 Tax=Asticcacaulis TaxID=76890 RepID=UPI0028548F31|nr:YihY/virulence factor BrkB family protein [Asticcacaulis sp. BE141]MBP2159172.1 membrane protein [Asticcacaulis solisilvae]MDR6800217.1 membrane protein [Asticcacaulis sp. BE141]
MSEKKTPFRVTQLVVGMALLCGVAALRHHRDALDEAATPAHRPVTISALIDIIKQTWQEWNDDEAPRLGAALAFYSVLSIGPLLLVSIWGAGLIFGEDNASRYILDEMRGMLGADGAKAIEDILLHTHNEAGGVLTAIIGLGTLIFSATGFFDQLQSTLNLIWNVPKQKTDLKDYIFKRLLSFSMVIGIGVLLLFSLIVSAALTALTNMLGDATPAILLQGVNIVLSFAITTFLFAIAFNVLPDIHIKWRDVWVGAALTALLFTVGKSLIGLYLGHSNIGTSYGTAGSMIILLVWIYYSAQIIFFGAEFTQVYTRYRNPGWQPVSDIGGLKRGRVTAADNRLFA